MISDPDKAYIAGMEKVQYSGIERKKRHGGKPVIRATNSMKYGNNND